MLSANRYLKLQWVKRLARSWGVLGVLLDAGCGSGFYLRAIPAQTKVGLDLVPPPPGQVNFPILKGDLLHIPLQNEVADLILCLDTLEHIGEDRKALEEMHRILRPGGVLILGTPGLGEAVPYKMLRFLMPSNTAQMHQESGHVRPGYSWSALRTLATESGFQVLLYRDLERKLCQVLDVLNPIDQVRGLVMRRLILRGRLQGPDSSSKVMRLRNRRAIRYLEGVHDFVFRLTVAPLARLLDRFQEGSGNYHLVALRRTQ